MSEKTKKPKPLTLQETISLLGAEQPQDIGPVQLDPMGMQVLATRVAERLAKKRGRPTDESWDMVRKIPMRRATWDRLEQMAAHLGPGVRVAAGQLGAIALERGVETLRVETYRFAKNAPSSGLSLTFKFHEESREEARALRPVLARGLW